MSFWQKNTRTDSMVHYSEHVRIAELFQTAFYIISMVALMTKQRILEVDLCLGRISFKIFIVLLSGKIYSSLLSPPLVKDDHSFA